MSGTVVEEVEAIDTVEALMAAIRALPPDTPVGDLFDEPLFMMELVDPATGRRWLKISRTAFTVGLFRRSGPLLIAPNE